MYAYELNSCCHSSNLFNLNIIIKLNPGFLLRQNRIGTKRNGHLSFRCVSLQSISTVQRGSSTKAKGGQSERERKKEI